VDVLHAIIERLGAAGASTLEDLSTAHRRATPTQLRKKHLADDVPAVPGVYQFLDGHGAVLYVGTSRNLRSRVRTYFTAAETRRRVLDMLPRAESIRTIECATATEAAIRELRIIAQERPPSNRHGLHPEEAHWPSPASATCGSSAGSALPRLGAGGIRGGRTGCAWPPAGRACAPPGWRGPRPPAPPRSGRSPRGTRPSPCAPCSRTRCSGGAQASRRVPSARSPRAGTARGCDGRWSRIPPRCSTTSRPGSAPTWRRGATRTPRS